MKASWVAVENGDKATILETLGLLEVGKIDHELEAYCCCATLPSGWFVIHANDAWFASEQLVSELSANTYAIACQMSETVMFSGVWGWRNGERVWSVEHDPEKQLDDVEVVGTAPEVLGSIRDRLVGEQKGNDQTDFIFEIPIELAVAMCGYKPPYFGDRPNLVLSMLTTKAAERAVQPQSQRGLMARLMDALSGKRSA